MEASNEERNISLLPAGGGDGRLWWRENYRRGQRQV